MPHSPSSIRLTLPGKVAFRELATRTVEVVCKLATSRHQETPREARQRFSHELVSAVGEAFNNVALHGCRNSGSPVTLDLSYDEVGVTVVMTDDGHAFDLGAVAAPDLDALPESGMGLFIINAFVDEVEYEAGPPNQLRLTKRLSS